MTKADRPYSRVYWEAVDDPKFASVWDDDRALAAWLRLLVAADMAWPASATLYHGIRKSALDTLVKAGLVDIQTGGRYRIHGLDKERERRSGVARAAANNRWNGSPDGMPPHTDADYDRNADALREHPESNAEGMPSRDEPRRAEQRRDKPSPARAADASPEDDDQLDVWYRLTGSWPSQKVIPWINELAGGHGCDRFAAALAEEFRIDPDRRDLLSRTQTRLEAASHAASKARRRADEEREAEERRRIDEMPAELRAENLARLKADMVERGLLPAGADR